MSKSRLFDPEKVARIFMDLPDDDPDFDGNEGDLGDLEDSIVDTHADACSFTSFIEVVVRW
jgi:hypothetical protein